MKNIQTSLPGLELTIPNPDKDALFAFAWFDSATGNDTLLRMGNAESEISKPSLEGERETLKKFLQLEEDGEQVTRMIMYKGITVGAVWIVLKDTKRVKAPALHIMIGDPLYRGMGIGKMVMETMIEYARNELRTVTVYSRHLVSNDIISKVSGSVGLIKDGEPYAEENGLIFQNVKLKKL